MTSNESFPHTPNYGMTAALLFISLFHIMIFAFFSLYGNFLNQQFIPIVIPLKSFFYTIVILTSISHQFLVRNFTLKSTLIAGLFSNIVGLVLIWWSISLGGILTLIFLSMFFIGMALTSVLNCLISYLVIEYPHRIGVMMIIMFAFGNSGNMVSNILFNAFKAANFNSGFFILTIGLMILSILLVAFKFIDPRFPEHLKHLRRGTLLWKEMHYRLVFFILCIIAYGIIETFFGLWSGLYLMTFLSPELAKEIVSLFWFSMLVGQVILLVPLYFFPSRRVFPFLILTLIFTIFFYQKQADTSGFVISAIFGGIGCAAIYPILLTFMEQEVVDLCAESGKENYLPYIETGTCLMLAGYFLGVAAVDLSVLNYIKHPDFPLQNAFHWAIMIIAGIGLLSTYLNWSSSSSD